MIYDHFPSFTPFFGNQWISMDTNGYEGIWILFDTSSTAQGGCGSFKNRKPIGEIGCCESGMAERSH